MWQFETRNQRTSIHFENNKQNDEARKRFWDFLYIFFSSCYLLGHTQLW